MLESLRQSVANALERKRRLDQYAVFWDNGPIFIGDEVPVDNVALAIPANPVKTANT